MIVLMNTIDLNSAWSDRRMREAMEYAIDKEKIAKSLGKGMVQPYYEIIHSMHDVTDPGTIHRKYDPGKARQLMKEAGYPDGLKVKAIFPSHFESDLFLALQADLAEVGINIDLTPVAHTTSIQMSFEPSPGNDLKLEGQRGGPGNLLGAVKNELSSKSVYLPGLKRPKGFDDLLGQALAEPDPEKQIELLAEMERLAYEDVMFVPLWNSPMLTVLDPIVKDAIWFYGGGPNPKLERAWLNKK